MGIAVLVARILLGLIFFVFGLNGFFLFMPAPPLSGDVGNLMSAIVAWPQRAAFAEFFAT
ncbi:MAG: hypothetical protein ABSE64_08815 [Vulcanimicrobiaceae bacterium]|jgi:uncharacterized membrane protein YphA (DoxX/SURF4 family)